MTEHQVPAAKTLKDKVFKVETMEAFTLKGGSIAVRCKVRNAAPGRYQVQNIVLKAVNQGYMIMPKLYNGTEFVVGVVSTEPYPGRLEKLGFDTGEVICEAVQL